MVVCRVLLTKDMFLNYFNIDLNQMAVYNFYIASPALMKMFIGMVIDARVVANRKYYLICCGIWTCVMQAAVGWKLTSN